MDIFNMVLDYFTMEQLYQLYEDKVFHKFLDKRLPKRNNIDFSNPNHYYNRNSRNSFIRGEFNSIINYEFKCSSSVL